MAGAFGSEVILPLSRAEHHFLQALVPSFSLRRSGEGVRLQVKFDGRTPALWSDRGKRAVRGWIRDFDSKSQKYQEQLDEILVAGQGESYDYRDEGFPFRYASGGTLPIVRLGRREYYCFFYRDIEPVGWNIANGGCDSLHELLNPTETIERELREELVAFDRRRREWLLFEAPEGQLSERPEFLALREMAASQFPESRGSGTTEVPLKWLDGPDELCVQLGDEARTEVRGCFLNINALDFGIEVDRIAWITIPPEAVLFDGETLGDYTVNSPVGLFEVDRLNLAVGAGGHRFLPDLFFYDWMRYEDGPAKIEGVALGQFAPRMAQRRPCDAAAGPRSSSPKFDLCPVTRRIVQRYLTTLVTQPPGLFDVFISFASEDKHIAQRVYNYLEKHSQERVFFSETTIHDGNWGRQIDEALLSAQRFILVGTSIENITKEWVEYEWRSFHTLILSGQKKAGCLVPVVIGVDERFLPLPLRFYQGKYLGNPDELDSRLPEFL